MQWIASLTRDAADDPLREAASPPAGADMVELRLDHFPDLEVESFVAACPLPVLATYRSNLEGGLGSTDPPTRRRVVRRARDAGAAMLDLEWLRDADLIADLGLPPEQVLLSWHDTEGTQDDIADTAAAMGRGGGAVIKIVTAASRLSDLERVLSLYRRAEDPGRLMAFAMGGVGLPSRFLAPLLGCPLGFSAWDESSAAAPGQLPPDRMNAVAGHLSGPPRLLFGVVGADVSASLSPVLHAAAYRACDLPHLMVPVSVTEAADLQEIFRSEGEGLFDRLGMRTSGWAVTTPFKTLAAEAATTRAPRVRRAGAANTLLIRGDSIIAENTDADGVVGSLTAAGLPPVGKRVLVQGTGGAARGAAVGLHLAGADVGIRSRDDARAEQTAEDLGLDPVVGDSHPDAEILVNATPIGSPARPGLPFSEADLDRAEAVVDMVYVAGDTELVAAARDRGLLTVDGRTMLAYQGMAQFAAFTATVPPRAAMLAALGLDQGSAGDLESGLRDFR